MAKKQRKNMAQEERDRLRHLRENLEWTGQKLSKISSDLQHVTTMYAETCEELRRGLWSIVCRELAENQS